MKVEGKVFRHWYQQVFGICAKGVILAEANNGDLLKTRIDVVEGSIPRKPGTIKIIIHFL